MSEKKIIKVCHGHKCCKFGENIMSRLKSDIERNPAKNVELEEGLCRGMCSEGPIVVVEKGGKTEIHKRMDPVKASKLL